MSKHSTVRRLIAATVIPTVIGLTSLAGGAVSADGPSLSDGTPATEVLRKKPGRTTFANVVLERGTLATPALTGPLTQPGDPVARYHLTDAWPAK